MPRRLSKYLADLVTFPGDAALAFRNEGLRGVWGAITPRTVHRIVRVSRLRIFAQPLDRIPAVTRPAGVTIARLRPEEIPSLTAVAGERDRGRFRRLLEIGCVGLVAWRAARPVGYAWVATEMHPEVSHCPLELPAGAAYLWDMYVVPAERSGGVGSALASERLHTARALGCSEGWRMITPDNAPSLRTLYRSGRTTRVVGEMRYLKLGPRLYSRFTPGPPGGDPAGG
jgi:GNAT superfamily N-acetyltransferase